MKRTWDLRSYTGDALGLLRQRSRAYGYWHSERFLSQIAQANGADILTDALGGWTTRLWQPFAPKDTPRSALFYIDGHPLRATTHRGDQHLTLGLPTIIKRYEQEAGLGTVQHIVVDREGMAAEFLAALKEAGRTAISILRTDQYTGLDSFTTIGSFVPLLVWGNAYKLPGA